MAQRHVIELIDDLDSTPINGAGGTHSFSLDGRAYEIDLSNANADRLREALAPFIQVARKAGKPSAPVTTSRGRARSREETDAIRRWARDNGYEVSERGRIAESTIKAYLAAS